MKNLNCNRNLSKEEIQKKFGISEEEINLCDKSNCKNLVYNNGMLECALLNK